ncbi:hypothetical protein Tco_0607728 [Tanacetum coccineum]
MGFCSEIFKKCLVLEINFEASPTSYNSIKQQNIHDEVLSWIVLEVLFDVACIAGCLSRINELCFIKRPYSGRSLDHASRQVFRPGPVWGCDRLVSKAKVLVNQVMTALVIPISSNSSEESVGSHVPRVILFDAIPAIIPVIPEVPADPLATLEVGAVYVTSPTGVLDLVDYSSFDFDPSEDSLPPALELPLVSPFLCSDDSEADSESKPAEVASRPSSPPGSSSHDTFSPSSEFPVALVVALPGIRQRPAILIRTGEAIPFDFTSYSSSSGLSLDSSLDTSSGSPLDSLSDTSSVHSSGFDASGQTHSGPSTRVVSSSSTPLSTPYPPMTSESSSDSSSERSLDSSLLYAGPSRKRCKSPTTLVPSSTPVSRSIAPTHADLLPPRKRFRDSYSPEDSREEHMEIGTANAEVVADLGTGDGVDTKDGIGMGVKIAASDIREDEGEFEAEASAGGTMEMAIDPLVTCGISKSTR